MLYHTDWTWDDWTVALKDYFFCPDDPTQTTYFCVDRFALSEITGRPEDEAVEIFADLIRQRVGTGHNYSSIWSECEKWKQSDCAEAPPSVPLLGATVLAAARMGKDERINPGNYYRPYRKLINRQDNDGGTPGDYEHVIWQMWDQLNDWLHAEPARGTSSIQPHPTYTHIGYALGQALIRSSDRHQLDNFFHWLQIDKDAGDVPPAAELRRHLRLWTKNKQEGSSRRLFRLADTEGFHDQCEEVLAKCLEAWDPTQLPPDPEGRRQGRIRLALKENPQFELGLVAPKPDGFPSGQAWSTDSNKMDIDLLEVSNVDSWYRPGRSVPGDKDQILLPDVDVQTAMKDGYALSTESHSLRFEPLRIYALQHDAEIGRKVSVDRIELGSVYDLLVVGEQRSAVQAFIDSEQLLAKIDPTLTQNGDTTWFFFRNFRLDARARHTPPSELAQLIGGGGGPRLRLVGGLQLRSGSRSYLQGGAPNLAIPPEYTARKFDLTFAQQQLTQSFPAQQSDGEYPLTALTLEPGSYQVNYENLSIDFEILDGLAEFHHQDAGTISRAGTGGRAYGYRVDAAEPDNLPRPRPPTTIPAPLPGHNSAYLGTGPENFEHPREPEWLKEFAPELTWTMLELDTSFEPVWLIDTAGKGFTASLIDHRPPDEGIEPGNTSWHRCIKRATLVPEAADATRELWERYLQTVRQA
jgi:hypothetical protein